MLLRDFFSLRNVNWRVGRKKANTILYTLTDREHAIHWIPGSLDPRFIGSQAHWIPGSFDPRLIRSQAHSIPQLIGLSAEAIQFITGQ